MVEIALREWQREAISKCLNWLLHDKGDHRFLVNAAPGSGKTICASVIAKQLIELKEIDRVVVIAPRTEVVRQWSEEFKVVTGRHMTKVTGSSAEIDSYGDDLCATWASIQGLLDGFQQVCNSTKTLIICDEHHHAAVEAAWGRGADGAFKGAKYVLILSGTPIRSDGKEPIWFAYTDEGKISHPVAGTYTLNYGEAVEYGYCRPITFHRHEGKFSVSLPDGNNIAVSGSESLDITSNLKKIPGLQQALDYYRVVCTPKYMADGKTPDVKSYQASMIEVGAEKLAEIQDTIPHAGGLIIAPNIQVAEYMSDLLEMIEGEKPTLVHSKKTNSPELIASFKNNNKKKWIVSVAMISEGVDIKRLRVLIYLPNAQTELAFRQSMGRIVRSLGENDFSRAYVVMPTHRIFEEYARRVEAEMSPSAREIGPTSTTKVCPDCENVCPKTSDVCDSCGYEFPVQNPKMKTCSNCEALNPISLEECQNCGHSFRQEFEISLKSVFQMGAIVKGMDIGMDEILSKDQTDKIHDNILRSGDENLLKILQQLPPESWGHLQKILNQQ
jgi:superfamily II DNA or RNA helicase